MGLSYNLEPKKKKKEIQPLTNEATSQAIKAK
jgi:hypothetical protein